MFKIQQFYKVFTSWLITIKKLYLKFRHNNRFEKNNINGLICNKICKGCLHDGQNLLFEISIQNMLKFKIKGLKYIYKMTFQSVQFMIKILWKCLYRVPKTKKYLKFASNSYMVFMIKFVRKKMKKRFRVLYITFKRIKSDQNQ